MALGLGWLLCLGKQSFVWFLGTHKHHFTHVPQIPDFTETKEGAKPVFLETPSTVVLCFVVCAALLVGFF